MKRKQKRKKKFSIFKLLLLISPIILFLLINEETRSITIATLCFIVVGYMVIKAMSFRRVAPIKHDSRYIPSRVKQEVWRRDGGRCVECGGQRRLEYDHIIPVARGGSNTTRNIQLLCQDCNRSKSSRIQ